MSNRSPAPSPGTTGLRAKDLLDPDFYLEANPDVAASRMGAAVHWKRHGEGEGRRPNAWFDPAWYAATYLGRTDGSAEGALDHFATQGCADGLPPSPEALEILEEAARVYFDDAGYLSTYPDIAATGLSPWWHYLNHGATEGRAASDAFDRTAWAAAHMGGRTAPLEPILHFALFASEEDRAAARQGPAGAAPQDAQEALLEAARAIGGPAPVLPDDDVALLAASGWFDGAFYRAATDLPDTLSDDEAARHFLETGAAQGLDPHPDFGSAFYADLYRRMPQGLEALACPEGSPAIIHYLRHGQQAGLYPNPQMALLEIEAIRASGQFSAETYAQGVDRRLILSDPVADYAVYGHLQGQGGATGVDDGFVRALYGPLIGAGLRAPLAFALRHKTRNWFVPTPAELRDRAKTVRACPIFDPAYYGGQAGFTPGADTPDPAEHYLTIGLFTGLSPSPEFDPGCYLLHNPDLARAGLEPLMHYDRHGRREGRTALLPIVTPDVAVGRTPDLARPLVILVSHEASRSGAPIVALNVARRLAEKNDVVVWLGHSGDGPLLADFADCAIALREGWGTPARMARELATLCAGRTEVTAVVNSAVCHPAIPALRIAGLPIVSLLHEFADYVSPRGTLARMSYYSDRTVFPAQIVAQACIDEMALIGAAGDNDGLRLRHQGHNIAISSEPGALTEADGVRALLGLPPARPGRRDRILFGAGQVQIRKGVDLFLQAAADLMEDPDHDWYFIWVGGGYDPDRDFATSVYLRHQMRATGLSKRTVLLPGQPDLAPFWDAADVFFLSSRLDPFPNVALDAWAARLPLVCFDGATGIAEVEEAVPFAMTVVPHCDAAAAARAITRFAHTSDETAAGFDGAAGAALRARLTFDSYVEQIDIFRDEARQNRADSDARRARLRDMSRADRGTALAAVPMSLHLGGRAVTDAAAEIETLVRFAPPVPPAATRSPAGSGQLHWKIPPKGHLLHIHVLDDQALTLAFGPEGPLAWVPRLASAMPVWVSGETLALARDLRAMIGGNKTDRSEPGGGISRRADPLDAVIDVLAQVPDVDRVTFLPLGAVLGDMGIPIVADETVGMATALFSGAADAELNASGCDVVTPVSRRDEEGPKLRALLADGHPSNRTLSRLGGTWDAGALRALLERNASPLNAARLSLSPVERLGHAAALAMKGDLRVKHGPRAL